MLLGKAISEAWERGIILIPTHVYGWWSRIQKDRCWSYDQYISVGDSTRRTHLGSIWKNNLFYNSLVPTSATVTHIV